jgi:hypothetical protein
MDLNQKQTLAPILQRFLNDCGGSNSEEKPAGMPSSKLRSESRRRLTRPRLLHWMTSGYVTCIYRSQKGAYRGSINANRQSSDCSGSIQNDAGTAKHRRPPQGAPPIGFSCSYKPTTTNQAGRIMNAPASSTASSLKHIWPPPPPPKSVCFSAVPHSGAPSYPPTAVTSREGSMSPSEVVAMSKRLEALEQQVRPDSITELDSIYSEDWPYIPSIPWGTDSLQGVLVLASGGTRITVSLQTFCMLPITAHSH